MARTVKTTPADLRQRARDPREHVQVAPERLALVDGKADPSAQAQVAASNAISAGIAAADAICGAVIGERANDPDHRSAVELLATVKPDGSTLAGTLRRLLKHKSLLQYGGYCSASGRSHNGAGRTVARRRNGQLRHQELSPGLAGG
jgi:hypothetical protein